MASIKETYDYIRSKGKVEQKKVQKALFNNAPRCSLVINKLVDRGLIVKVVNKYKKSSNYLVVK